MLFSACIYSYSFTQVKSLTLGRRYNIDDLHQLGTSKLLPDLRSNAQTKSQPGLPARRRSSEESADTTRSLESLSAWTRMSIAEPGQVIMANEKFWTREQSNYNANFLTSFTLCGYLCVLYTDLFAELLGGPLSSTKKTLIDATSQLPALK